MFLVKRRWLFWALITVLVSSGAASGCGSDSYRNDIAEQERLEEESRKALEQSIAWAEEGAAMAESLSALEDPGVEENYLGGASLSLLASENGAQNLSCVVKTVSGKVIVVDGGWVDDAPHLLEVIDSMGGRVDAWLVTHPHSDHAGALMTILNQDPITVEIGAIYYSFLSEEEYAVGENMGRMEDYRNIVASLESLKEKGLGDILHEDPESGTEFSVGDATVRVMNEPMFFEDNTFNNSSVAYRLDLAGKRILFLGDLGWQAGEKLLKLCAPEDLKADVVQMAHHGQSGVDRDVYEVIAPEVCLWPTPQWLWDNEKDGIAGAGSYWTLEVRSWMQELGVKKNLSVKDGDAQLR